MAAYYIASDTLRNRLPMPTTTNSQGRYQHPLQHLGLALFFLVLPLLVHSQEWTEEDIIPLLQQANTYGEAAAYEKGDRLLEQALALLLKQQPQNDSLLGLTYFMISKTKQLAGQWQAAVPNMKQAAHYYKAAYGALSSEHADAVYSLGRIFFDVHEDIDSVYFYYYKALDLYKQMDKKLDIGWNHRAIGSIQAFTKDYAGALASCELAIGYLQAYRTECESKGEEISRSYYLQLGQAYLLMAELYAAINDEQRSVLLAQRAWQVVEEQEEVHQLMRYYVLNNQAQFHAHRGDFRAALASFETLLAESEGEKAPSERRIVYKDMARFHTELREYDQALAYHQQILDLNEVIQAKDKLHYAETYLEMAKIYRLQRKERKAEQLLEKAYDISQRYQRHWRISQVATEKALLLDQQGRHQKALHWMQQAFTPSYPPKSSPEAAQLLAHQAAILLHQSQKTRDSKPLQEADQLINESLQLIQLFTEETFKRRDFIKDQLKISELALQIKQALYQMKPDPSLVKEAFALSEAAKVNTLRLTLREQQGAQAAGIPAAVLQREKDLKGKLTMYRQRLHYLSQRKEQQQAQRYQWQDSVFHTSTALQQLKERLERDYPDYYRLKYDNQSISLPAIQDQLLSDEALLEYFVGEENAFVFVITQNNIHWQVLPTSSSWSDDLLNLREEVSASAPTASIDTFASIAHRMYQRVAAPAFSLLPKEIKKVTIVADGLLNLLPFEILLADPPNTVKTFATAPYLLTSYTIAYAYSATWLWSDWKKNHPSGREELGAFAANYDSYRITEKDTLMAAVFQDVVRSGFLPLPGAEQEVKDIAALYATEPFLKSAATKAQFEAVASQYKILHLAMHAFVEERAPQFSRLLFSQTLDGAENGQLSAQELSNYELNADLVVLSACNTGVGKMKRGEGLMSLSHAFALAGVPATVMSLWKIPDQTTPQLMVSFYENLQAGMPKHEALQQAKLAYLDQTKIDRLAHPYYWAGFMLMGNPKPIESDGLPLAFWFTIILAIVGGYLYYRFPENRDTSPSAGS